MKLKLIVKIFIFFLNLQIYANCDGDLLGIVDHASFRFRSNFTEDFHNNNEFAHRHFLSNETPLARRLANTIRSTTFRSTNNLPSNYNNQFTPNLNRDPLWNSNNRFTNRFDRISKKIPQFLYTTYSTYAYDSFTSTQRPSGHYFRPTSKPNSNSIIIIRPSHETVSSNIRPINVKPNYSSNSNSRPNYNADCACKRKIGSSNHQFSTSTTPSVSTFNSTTFNNRQTRSNRNKKNLNNNSSSDKDIDTRIVNGTVADYFKYPFMVSLGRAVDGKYKNESHYCGSTLISPYYVMSAAHCLTDFRPKKVIVAYGSGDRTKMQNFVDVDQWIVHPNYSGWPKYLNDIALVKLKQPVHFDGSIKPACLHSSLSTHLSKEFDAIGWGRLGNEDEFPVQLQKTKFDFVNTMDCKNRWSKEDEHPDITNKNICVYNPTSDICGGDSGSPLINFADDGVSYVVGVASFTNFCDQTQPAVYVRVYPYIDWIISIVKNFC